MMSTTYDPVVNPGNQDLYYKKLTASAKAKGDARSWPASTTRSRRPNGWTQFQPGAKGPDAAASAALATSGVGHCNWTEGGGIQIVNAVTALNRMVNNPTTKGVKSANRLMWGTVGRER